MKSRHVKRTFKLIPYRKAQLLLCKVARVKSNDDYEEIPILESLGRVAAKNMVADRNIPSENRAVFDGYAVQSIDTKTASPANPAILRIVGETFPDQKARMISSGQTVFTACGAPLPRTADAIIKVENVRLHEDKIEVRFAVAKWENVALFGEDVRKRQSLLNKGRFIRPQDIGLMAGLGIRQVKVIRKPRVGIISVGDELILSKKKGELEFANNYALIVSNLVTEMGGTPRLFGIVPDDLQQIEKAISMAVRQTDIVATIAGCSVGPKDLVPDAIASLSGRGLLFHGVKLSPGKVMGAGIVKGKPIVMLPGHIVSAYASFHLLIAPLIAQHLGFGSEFPFPTVSARLTDDVEAKPIATFLRLRLKCANGGFEAEPVHGGAGVLTTIAGSNGYMILPERKTLRKGACVKVTLYNRYEYANVILSSTEGA